MAALDSVIRQALTDRVIRYDEVHKRFECLLCDVKLSGEPVLDHLKSKQHREVGARYAIQNLAKSPRSLLDILPDSVRDAAKAGDISVMDTKEIICHICNSPNSGVVALNNHLVSKSHLKKRESSRPQSQVQENRVPSSGLGFTFMNPTVQQAVNEKIVDCINFNEFHCILCDLKFNGEVPLEQHLESKKHREAGARFAISNFRTAPRSLIDKLTPAVKDAAARDGKVIVTESKDFLCTVCNVSLTGVVSLEDHLVGGDHLKNAMQGLHIVPSLEAVSISQEVKPSVFSPECSLPGLISAQPARIASPVERFHPQNPAVQEAVSEKIVDCISFNEFHCKLCESRFNGEVSLEQHLESKKHREAIARLAISSFRTAPRSLIDKLPPVVKDAVSAGKVIITDSKKFYCSVCMVSLNGVVSLNDHLVGDDHIKKDESKVLNSTPLLPAPSISLEVKPPISSSDYPAPDQSAQQLNVPLHRNPEIAKALEEGIVTKTDNKLDPFCCKLCDKKFNKDGPFLDHLRSRKHLQKKNLFDNQNNNPPPRIMNPDGEGETKTVQSSETTIKKYSVISDVRGHVYVFNNTFKKTEMSRRGAEHDSRNLEDTFSKMGYKVYVHEDLTGEQTLEALERIRRKPELNEIDSFIMCFLSHGVNEYTFLANDKEQMDLRIIRRKFTDRKCPHLRGKPKIFFVNYCRGDQMQRKEIEYDSIEVPNDMVTIHAATEGIMARRTPTTGTIFVASLCEVLRAHAQRMELRDLYCVLEEKMNERQGTKPMWEDYGFRHFFFNPT